MKKRGGVKSVSMSSILSNTVKRPLFMEPLNNKVYKTPSFIRTNYKLDGPRLKFKLHTPAGHAKVVVDRMLDEEEQQNAYNRFNRNFKQKQDYYIDKLNKGELAPNTLWVCVRVGVDKGLWQLSDGSWKMLPTVVSGYYYNNDFKSLVMSGKILRDNAKKKFWVPDYYFRSNIPASAGPTSSAVGTYD
jgi:hypothetical protein